jgi:hypothetical protein
MLGFSPLASNPLGDDGGVTNIELTASNIASQAPSVDNTTLTQTHSLDADDLSSGSPLLQTVSLTQSHIVTSVDLTFGTPVLGGPSITQEHDLTFLGILTGIPVLPQANVAEDETFTAPATETESPDIGTVNLAQNQNLSANSLTTQQPTVSIFALSQTSVIQPDDILTPVPDVDEPVDPNAIIVREIEEIEQMFGGWQRRTYEVPDGRLVQSEREIQSTHGDVVSIDRKAKSLLKFGKSAELVANTLETVWTVGGNEAYVSDNDITHISSSSGFDTQEVRVEGHTISGDDLTFVVQLVTLSGQTPVALNTGVARISRISNNSGTELVGRVVAYEDTATSNGVPTDETKIHIDIPLGFQQSFKAATSFSKEDYYVMTGFYGAVSAKQSAAVDFYIEVKKPNGVFLQTACFTASSTGGNSDISLDPAIIVPKNSDVRVRCETTDNNAVVFGIFKGYLAKVTG